MTTYVGIPFAKGGRSREGLDCFGLVRLWLKENVGVSIPDVLEATTVGEVLDIAGELQFEAVKAPRHGDVVVMAPAHLGVYLAGGKVLHTTRRCGTVIERITAPAIRRRVKGFLRWQVTA